MKRKIKLQREIVDVFFCKKEKTYQLMNDT